MKPENLIGDMVAIIASLVALSYVIGIWRMVRAPSRIVLIAAMLYMVISRCVILALELVPGDSWIETHRQIAIVPQYVLFAVAFGMTYYELRAFHFDVPKNGDS